MNFKLDDYRGQIDNLDEQLLKILAARIRIVRKIGLIKKKKNVVPLDVKRWQKVLISRMDKGEKLGVPSDLIKNIYKLIHDKSLIIQKSISKKSI